MKNKYQSVANSNIISITFCSTFKAKGSMIERACCGEGIKPDITLSEPYLSVLAHRAIHLSRREICPPSWWCYGKRRVHEIRT